MGTKKLSLLGKTLCVNFVCFWFKENKFKTIEFKEGINFEGAGDCLVSDECVFMGYGFRSDLEVYSDPVWDALGITESIRLKLINYLSILNNLSKLNKDSNFTRRKNRCFITCRSSGNLRKFSLSRIKIRELSNSGLIVGFTKASW